MRVLLINPDWPAPGAGRKRYRRRWPPLDLLTAAALLRREGHSVELIDARAVKVGPDEIKTRAGRADLVLFQTTPLDRWQCPDLNWRALTAMTAGLPREKLVVAGAHGTLAPELVFAATGAAALIRGELELPLAALAEAGGDPRQVAGVSFRDAGVLVHNPRPAMPALDRLPAPAYDIIEPERYGYELLGSRLALIETSRGCPYHCTFCLKSMYGQGVRYKSLDRTMAEVIEVVEKWGAGNVYFFDLEFTLRREATMALCREIERMNLNFHWTCQTRVDTVDMELLKAMKAAGCRLIHFGIETGSPELLAAVRKGATLEQARAAVRWCGELGIETACFFLFGLPGETEAHRRATRHFSRSLGCTYASFHVAAPYPGTALGVEATEPFSSCLPEHDLGGLAREARKAFLAFYLRPGYVIERLRRDSLRDHIRRLRLWWEFVG